MKKTLSLDSDVGLPQGISSQFGQEKLKGDKGTIQNGSVSLDSDVGLPQGISSQFGQEKLKGDKGTIRNDSTSMDLQMISGEAEQTDSEQKTDPNGVGHTIVKMDRSSNANVRNENQVQKDVPASIQDAARKFNEQVSAFNGFAERIKKLGKVEKDRFNALANNEVASASEDKTEKVPTLEDKANPTALSEDFREKCEEEGLGLETTAWTDENNNINFKITKVKEDRADLEDFKDYIVSISGLKNNEALIDFVSAVRVVGFEAAVKYMNELDKNNKVELVLLDKEGKKIEDKETLNNFKKLTVPREQLEDLNISNEKQSTIGEEDSDIRRKSTSASQNDFEMLDSVSSAEAEVGMKLEKPQPRRMIVVGTTN